MVLDSSPAEVNRSYEMRVPTAFRESLFYHEIVSMSGEVEKKKPYINQNAENRFFAGKTVQLVQKSWMYSRRLVRLNSCGLSLSATHGSNLLRYIFRYHDNSLTASNQGSSIICFQAGQPLLESNRAGATARDLSPQGW